MLLKKSGLRQFAKKIAKEVIAKDIRLVALDGEMGSGKTTFAGLLIKELGCKNDAITSPTFNIVNKYDILNFGSVFHYDLHRLQTEDELDDVLFFDNLEEGRLIVAEWFSLIKTYKATSSICVYFARVDSDVSLRQIDVVYSIV
ncbi:MAG: tRNA (adenosine(37)-N6)-threonylcarbamoyltransferase complex ATPase subunit type 1 TsaE [Alphaproteobacteria bacterium]|nr:tRNA (adenosine(37)-N6)-threonylcarbamoyltransferase complex ATPase subunit type 1 TsaE [Rickettsiales bacterium]